MAIKNIPLSVEEIMQKIIDRREARQGKDWTRADAIRKELEEKGIILEDKKGTTSWRVRLPITGV
jgi:cysteinyl-tRNA synthetase